MEWLSEQLTDGRPKLVDTRTQAEFDQGHLPGAVSWDWFNAVPPSSWNCTREPGDLRAEWETLGLHPSHEIVVYCRSGMRAAHTFVAMKHAGYARVRLYDGSWQEWSMKA
jgi:thiosulfate/3-mercaptopyruvate sulfurtransferase